MVQADGVLGSVPSRLTVMVQSDLEEEVYATEMLPPAGTADVWGEIRDSACQGKGLVMKHMDIKHKADGG